MEVIKPSARGIDVGNFAFTLLKFLTHFSIFFFNPTEETFASQGTFSSHSSQYINLPMTWLGEIKPNGSYIGAT